MPEEGWVCRGCRKEFPETAWRWVWSSDYCEDCGARVEREAIEAGTADEVRIAAFFGALGRARTAEQARSVSGSGGMATPEWAEDVCARCGAHVGQGNPEYHLGLCEACDAAVCEAARAPYREAAKKKLTERV
jgi:hypothetical protein